jgi:hypothetical protein
MTDYNIENELQEYLDDNEKLVWTGRPRQAIFFRWSDTPMLVAGCVFAVLILRMHSGEPLSATKFSLTAEKAPFLCFIFSCSSAGFV